MVLHLQNAHPVRPVGPRAVRQDLLHAGAAGASASLIHLKTRGGDALNWARELAAMRAALTGVQRDIPFVTIYFCGAAPQASYISRLNSR